MSIWRPLIAILAFAGLLGFYLWDVDHVERAILEDLQEQQVLYQDPREAVALEIVHHDRRLRLEREGPDAEWQIVEPIRAGAADGVISAYLENLRGARRQSRLKEANPAEYGLASPELTVTLKMKNAEGTRERSLLFGKQMTDFGNVYAKLGDEPEIFTVSEWLYRQSMKSVADVRDKSLGLDEVARAAEIGIETRRHDFKVAREDRTSTSWNVVYKEGIKMPGDRSLIDRVQTTVGGTAFVDIYDEPTTSTEAMGLNDPTLRLSVDDSEVLRLGSTAGVEDLLYARTADGTIGSVSAARFAHFFRHPIEWGTKRFVWLADKEIEQIYTASGDATMTLMKTNKGWIFVEAPGMRVRKDKLEELKTNLLSLQAVKLIEPTLEEDEWRQYGILEESYRVIVEDTNGKRQGIRFGRADARQGRVYALREQDRSLWQVDFRQQSTVYRFRANLREDRIIPELIERTAKLGIESEKINITLSQTKDGWDASTPDGSSYALDSRQVRPLLESMQELEVESELYTRDHLPPVATLRLFEEGAGDPYRILELIEIGAEQATFASDGKRIMVPFAQYDAFDKELARLMMVVQSARSKEIRLEGSE